MNEGTRDFIFGALIGGLIVWLMLHWQASAATSTAITPVQATSPGVQVSSGGGGCGCGGGSSQARILPTTYVPQSVVPYTAPTSAPAVSYSSPREGYAA